MMKEEKNSSEENEKEEKDTAVHITITEAEKQEWEKFLDEDQKKKKTSIRLRIDGDVKKRWRDFVENSEEFKNVSHLIREAVNNFILNGRTRRIPDEDESSMDFDACFKKSLFLVDNWKNYSKVRELEEIIKKFNKFAKRERKQEDVQNKLLEIQSLLVTIILEIVEHEVAAI